LTEPSRAVFLSYASQDAQAAKRICETLRAAGIEVWFDQSELRGGDAWDQKIRGELHDCALFIPVISANTAARHEGYFRLEWNLADQRTYMIARNRAFIVPVCVDGTSETGADTPESFQRVQWTRLPAGETSAAFVERVQRLLSGETSTANRAAVASGALPALGGRAPRRHALLIGVIAAAVFAVGALVAYRMVFRSQAIGMVAVLPFENATGNPANDYLGNGISESLINKLSSVSSLHVISRTSAFAFKGKAIDPIEIGKKLGVDALILGNLSLHDSRLKISAELVRARDSTQLWGDNYERAMDDVQQLEGQIATTIAQTLRTRLSGDEKGRLTHIETRDPEAYRLYLKGRESLVRTDADMSNSIAFFQQAVARAPDYATAYAGLAAVYSVEAFLGASVRAEAAGKARAAANRALELEPNLGEAHTALADILFLFEWDWASADAEYRRGVALSPGSEAVHESYGSYLNTMGRLDEGLAESREAARLDPLSVQPFHDMAINALLRRDFDKAAAGFRHTIEIDPQWTWGYIKLARTLALAKKCKEAYVQADIAERRIAGGVGALSRSWLGSTYATCGDMTRAREKLDELHAFEAKKYVDPATFADIHASLGEIDEAVHWYRKALQDRSPDMVFMQVGSRLNPRLAADAGFRAILDEMAFPPSAK
jgi:TolB-like protein/Tfp pilus assembly protein PilF